VKFHKNKQCLIGFCRKIKNLINQQHLISTYPTTIKHKQSTYAKRRYSGLNRAQLCASGVYVLG